MAALGEWYDILCYFLVSTSAYFRLSVYIGMALTCNLVSKILGSFNTSKFIDESAHQAA